MKRRVKIGKNNVLVMDGHTTAVFSSGNKGKSDAGKYYFWTAVCHKSGLYTQNVYGRAFTKLDAGERFRRMERERKTALGESARKAYAEHWECLKDVIYVRASLVSEVLSWLNTHPADASFLTSLDFHERP